MSARIMVGRYVIKPDVGRGWVAGIPTMTNQKQGDGSYKDVEVMAGPTYHGRLDHALTSLLDRSLRESDARSLDDVRTQIREFKKLCAPVFEVTR